MENFDESVRRHRADWDSFVKVTFWFSVHIIIVLILMAIFLL
jgi:hypothetical protein